MKAEGAERRLAAILFTDVVGYTALMGRDEQAGRRVRERHTALTRELVERHRGTWIEERGDESLSSFSSALDAVRCALAIRDALAGDAELRVRAGVHVGDVTFEGGRVFGDGVNVASRIRELAEPGGVCVSGEVFHAVRNQPGIEGRALGARPLKNVSRPVEVWAIGEGAEAPPRRVPWWPIALASAALVALAAAYLVWPLGAPTRPPPKNSVAVLPFVDMSPDGDQAYLADGLAEELINALTAVDGLRVVSRTSSFRFRDPELDVREIGRRLGVASVLEGSVRRAGDELRVTVQLIDVADGYHRWSRRFDRPLEDVFAIQDEISRSVVESFELATGWQGGTRASARPTNIEAYEETLRGIYRWRRLTPEDLKAADAHLARAIELDPSYPTAWAWRAHVRAFVDGVYGTDDPEAPIRWAERAIALDPELPAAYSARGMSVAVRRWDFTGAERDLRRALELGPDEVGSLGPYGWYLLSRGRAEEAVRLLRRAVEFEPLVELTSADLALALWYAGREQEASRQLDRALSLAPDFPRALLYAGKIHAARGELEQGRRHLERCVEVTRGIDSDCLSALGVLHAQAGRAEEARGVLARLVDLSGEYRVWPVDRARVLLALGEKEAALAEIERAMKERDGWIWWIASDPDFAPLRSDPRFARLLEPFDLDERG